MSDTNDWRSYQGIPNSSQLVPQWTWTPLPQSNRLKFDDIRDAIVKAIQIGRETPKRDEYELASEVLVSMLNGKEI